MAFCDKCGAYIAFGCDSCPACGYNRNEAEKEEKERAKRTQSASATATQNAPEPEETKREEPRQREQERENPKTEETRTGNGENRNTGKSGEYHSGTNYRCNRSGTSGEYGGNTGKYGYYDAQQNKNPYSSTYRHSYGPAGKSKKRTSDDSEAEYYADPYDARKNRSMSYLCYFGPLFVIPYFFCRDSEFVRFHSNQGLLMTLFAIATKVLSVFPVLGWLIGAVGTVATIVMFIKGISNVSHGRMKELPIIGKIRLIK